MGKPIEEFPSRDAMNIMVCRASEVRQLEDENRVLRACAEFFADCLGMRAVGSSKKRICEFRAKWEVPDGVSIDDFAHGLVLRALAKDVVGAGDIFKTNPKCPHCGDTPSCGDGAWRVGHLGWEHRCRDTHPQAGYFSVPANGATP